MKIKGQEIREYVREYRRLIDKYKREGVKVHTRKRIANDMGLSVQQADRYKHIYSLISEIQELVYTDVIGMSNAYPIASHSVAEQHEIHIILQDAINDNYKMVRSCIAQIINEYRSGKFGRNEPRSVWSDKLRCSCGSAFRRFRWRTNRDGREMYGYQCYRQTRNVRARYYLDHGLDATRVCQSKSIPGWHIDLMTRMVFQQVWSERKEAILMACQMLEECAEDTIETSVLAIGNLETQIEKLEKSLGGLRRMRSLEEISREEYQLDSLALKEEIQQLQAQIELLRSQTRSQKLGIDMEEIRSTLEQWIDLSSPTISDPIIDQFVLQVVVIDDNTYNFTLDLAPQIQKNGRLRPSEIALKMYHHARSSAEYPIDTRTCSVFSTGR